MTKSIREYVRNLTAPAFLILALTIAMAGQTLSATPPSAPVQVEFTTPPPMATGEEATTVLTFRALADLDRLEVSVRAFDGLAVVSTPTAASFQNVKKGDDHQLTVTVRLTGPKTGSLAIFFTTHRGAKRDSGTSGITFGASGN
jgi:hypothetical protein